MMKHGVFVIPPSEEPKLMRLYERFGIGAAKVLDGDVGENGDIPVEA